MFCFGKSVAGVNFSPAQVQLQMRGLHSNIRKTAVATCLFFTRFLGGNWMVKLKENNVQRTSSQHLEIL
jgi:hypothetical protein